MEKFDFQKKGIAIISFLEKMLKEGQAIGLNLDGASSKIASLKSVIKENKIKIALIGRFSDGKTSILAGILGEEVKGMKIGLDETSDDIKPYEFKGHEGVEFVDTPGLFGTKEKEIDGDNIKISSMTEKFLSEAHIILYVCDARTPIRNTHESLIFDILRKYKKLGVTLFILNKMDTVCAVDIKEDYEESAAIKKQWLIDGLKRCINLSDEEAKQIQCICISANPDELGMSYWLNNQDYEVISRIGILRKTLSSLITTSDKENLCKANVTSISKDILSQIEESSNSQITPQENQLATIEESHLIINGDKVSIEKTLVATKHDLRIALDTERLRLINSIENATLETISSVINKNFGTTNKDGQFGVMAARVDDIIEQHTGSSSELELQCQNTVRTLEGESTILGKIIEKCGGNAKKIKVNNSMVKAGRDKIAPSFKFKPYGAIKLAEKINKGIAVLGLLIDAWQQYKDWKAQEELEEFKSELKEYVGSYFNELNEFISDDNKFYSLIPAFITMCNVLKEKEKELNECKLELGKLRAYQEKIRTINEKDIQDVDFEELN